MSSAPSSNSYIAIVDDDAAIRSALGRALRMENYDVELFEDGISALKSIQLRAPDAIVLDLHLPDIDGLEICRRIRRSGDSTPILMLTARDEKESRIKGLEMGADDYLAKPFEPRELSLRVASILRRVRPPSAPPAESVRFGPFVFHFARGELRRGEDVIRLTDREREMLRVLAMSVGETVPRQALAGNGDSVSERTVDVQVNRLRRKIEDDPANPLIVQTVRGFGYRLVAAP